MQIGAAGAAGEGGTTQPIECPAEFFLGGGSAVRARARGKEGRGGSSSARALVSPPRTDVGDHFLEPGAVG